jgi:hypothetical protein
MTDTPPYVRPDVALFLQRMHPLANWRLSAIYRFPDPPEPSLRDYMTAAKIAKLALSWCFTMAADSLSAACTPTIPIALKLRAFSICRSSPSTIDCHPNIHSLPQPKIVKPQRAGLQQALRSLDAKSLD